MAVNPFELGREKEKARFVDTVYLTLPQARELIDSVRGSMRVAPNADDPNWLMAGLGMLGELDRDLALARKAHIDSGAELPEDELSIQLGTLCQKVEDRIFGYDAQRFMEKGDTSMWGTPSAIDALHRVRLNLEAGYGDRAN
jgi:hypothetical protein